MNLEDLNKLQKDLVSTKRALEGITSFANRIIKMADIATKIMDQSLEQEHSLLLKPQDILPIPIEVISENRNQFSPAVRSLKDAGFETLQDLTDVSVLELLEIKRVGKGTIILIVEILKLHNLKLKDGNVSLGFLASYIDENQYQIKRKKTHRIYMKQYRKAKKQAALNKTPKKSELPADKFDEFVDQYMAFIGFERG